MKDCKLRTIKLTKNDITPTGFIATASARYLLVEDVHFEPTVDGVAMMVEASNVVIDLGGKTIKGNHLAKIGVKIKEGAHNILVTNGTITQFKNDGINITGTQGVIVKNIKIDTIGGNGISVDTSSALIEGVHIDGVCGVSPCGIVARDSNLIIERTNISRVGGTTPVGMDISQSLASIFCKIRDCAVDEVVAENGAFGIKLRGKINFIIESSKVTYIISRTDGRAVGINLEKNYSDEKKITHIVRSLTIKNISSLGDSIDTSVVGVNISDLTFVLLSNINISNLTSRGKISPIEIMNTDSKIVEVSTRSFGQSKVVTKKNE